MPTLTGLLETSLYVDDLERAAAFYGELFAIEPMVQDGRFCAFAIAGRDVLLLFRRGASDETAVLPGGTIPPHDGDGRIHIAFSVPAAELADWEQRLSDRKIAVEGRVDWPRGGRSIYFRDPYGHLLELATPGLWAIY